MNDKSSLITLLQEIKSENPNFFCLHPLHILTWKSKTVPQALVTKVNGQRYLGLLRKDIKGQDYWKYQPLKGSNSESSEELAPIQTSDNVAKFQQRQAQAKEYDEANNTIGQSQPES